MSVKYLNSTGLAYFWSKLKALIEAKQDTLVSGSNIKTVNSQPLLGSGDITIEGGGATETITSADIASFNTQSKSPLIALAADIIPVQSLNGYDRPWTGGCGKNLIPYPYYQTTVTTNGITFTVGADGTVTANGTATANAYFFVRRITQATLGLPTGNYVMSCLTSSGASATYSAYWYQTDGKSSAGAIDTGAGQNVTINDTSAQFDITIRIVNGTTVNNVVFKPMLRKSTESADWEPYENVCPISGWDAVKVSRTGKNLLPYPYYRGNSYVTQGITWTVDGQGIVTANRTGTQSGTAYYAFLTQTQGVKVLKGGEQYTLSLEVENGTCSVYCAHYLNGANVGEYAVRNLTDGKQEVTFTAMADDAFDCNAIALYIGQTQTVGNTKIKAMLRPASVTDSTWESPVNNETTSVPLGQTVYGGTLNVTTGELTVDRRYVEYDGSSDEAWEKYRYGYRISLGSENSGVGYSNKTICNRLVHADSAHNPVSAYGISGQFAVGSWFNINLSSISSITDVASLRTWLSNNPLQLVYELATPITYQLTAAEVKTLLVNNIIWTDAGTVDVTYRVFPETQSDWAETDTESVAYIRNKPDLGNASKLTYTVVSTF